MYEIKTPSSSKALESKEAQRQFAAWPTGLPGTGRRIILSASLSGSEQDPDNDVTYSRNPLVGMEFPIPGSDPLREFADTFVNELYESSAEAPSMRVEQLMQQMIKQVLDVSINTARELWVADKPKSRRTFIKRMLKEIAQSDVLKLHEWPIAVSVHLFGNAGLIETLLGYTYDALKRGDADTPTVVKNIEAQLRKKTSWLERLLRDVSLREALGPGMFAVTGSLRKDGEKINTHAAELQSAGLDMDVVNTAMVIESKINQIEFAVPVLEKIFFTLNGQTISDAKKQLSPNEYQSRMLELLSQVHQPDETVFRQVVGELYPVAAALDTKGRMVARPTLLAAGSEDLRKRLTDPLYKKLEWRSQVLMGFKKTAEGIDVIDLKQGNMSIDVDGVENSIVAYSNEKGETKSLAELVADVKAAKLAYKRKLYGSQDEKSDEEAAAQYLLQLEHRRVVAAFKQRLLNDPEKNLILSDDRRLLNYIRKHSAISDQFGQDILMKHLRGLTSVDFGVSMRYLPFFGVHGGEHTANMGFGQSETILDFNASAGDEVSNDEVKAHMKLLATGQSIAATKMYHTSIHLMSDGATSKPIFRLIRADLRDGMAGLNVTNLVTEVDSVSSKRRLENKQYETFSIPLDASLSTESSSIEGKNPPAEFVEVLPSLPGALVASPKVRTENVREGARASIVRISEQAMNVVLESVDTVNMDKINALRMEFKNKWLSLMLDRKLRLRVTEEWQKVVRTVKRMSDGQESFESARQNFFNNTTQKLREELKQELLTDPENKNVLELFDQIIDQINESKRTLDASMRQEQKKYIELKKSLPKLSYLDNLLGRKQIKSPEYIASEKEIQTRVDSMIEKWKEDARGQLSLVAGWFFDRFSGDPQAMLDDEEFAQNLKYVTVSDKHDAARKGELLLGKPTTFGITTWAEHVAEAARRASGKYDVLYGDAIAVSTLRSVVGLAELPGGGRIGMADSALTESAGSSVENFVRTCGAKKLNEAAVVAGWERFIQQLTMFTGAYYPLLVHAGRSGADSASMATYASGRKREKLLKRQVAVSNEKLYRSYFGSILLSCEHTNSDDANEDFFTVQVPTNDVRDAIGATLDHSASGEKLTLTFRHVIRPEELDNLARSRGHYSFKKHTRFGKQTTLSERSVMLHEYERLKKLEAADSWKWQIANHALAKLKDGNEVAEYVAGWNSLKTADKEKFGSNFLNFVVTYMAIMLGVTGEQILKVTGKKYLDFSEDFPIHQ